MEPEFFFSQFWLFTTVLFIYSGVNIAFACNQRLLQIFKGKSIRRLYWKTTNVYTVILAHFIRQMPPLCLWPLVSLPWTRIFCVILWRWLSGIPSNIFRIICFLIHKDLLNTLRKYCGKCGRICGKWRLWRRKGHSSSLQLRRRWNQCQASYFTSSLPQTIRKIQERSLSFSLKG
jgi:hypothetical protein